MFLWLETYVTFLSLSSLFLSTSLYSCVEVVPVTVSNRDTCLGCWKAIFAFISFILCGLDTRKLVVVHCENLVTGHHAAIALIDLFIQIKVKAPYIAHHCARLLPEINWRCVTFLTHQFHRVKPAQDLYLTIWASPSLKPSMLQSQTHKALADNICLKLDMASIDLWDQLHFWANFWAKFWAKENRQLSSESTSTIWFTIVWYNASKKMACVDRSITSVYLTVLMMYLDDWMEVYSYMSYSVELLRILRSGH